MKVICLKRAEIQFLKVAKFYRRFCSSGLPYLHLSITANTLQDSDGQGIEFTDKSCTRKLSRCQLERCQCHTLVCCIIIAAFLPTEVKTISIVSAFSVKINKMYKN